jgi:sulfite exporter TauE/SafE
MLIAMACYLSQWWMGILVFERLGQHVWRWIQPISLRFTPLQHLGQVYCFGLLWGLLPCGLVYSMLMWAGSLGQTFSAVLLMIGFGLGTLPAMLVSGYSATQLRKILQHQHLRMATSLLLMVFATWTIISALQHGHSAEHSGHHRH